MMLFYYADFRCHAIIYAMRERPPTLPVCRVCRNAVVAPPDVR
jgi:hypothetical protein